MSQGWRSLHRALHPQLPLSQRESGKLLNALKSSFRRHLDDAHPTSAAGPSQDEVDNKKALPPVGLNSPATSAASAADDHLATVLTSPLFLSQSGTPRTSSHNHALPVPQRIRQPIDLLAEKFQDKTLDVIGVQHLLKQFHSQLRSLPVAQQKAQIRAAAPGRRTLEWLYRNYLIQGSPSWLNKTMFLRRMCYFLMIEGHERDIWTWMKLDLPSDRGDPAANVWKDQLLAQLLRATKIVMPAIDAMLARFMSAAHLKDSASPDSSMRWLALYPAHCEIMNHLTSGDMTRRLTVDRNLFTAYAQRLQKIEYPEDAVSLRIDKAWIHLLDPQTPDAIPALRLILELHNDPSGSAMVDQAYSTTNALHQKGNKLLRTWTMFLLNTATVLEDTSRSRDARWVRSFLDLPRTEKIEGKSPKVRNAYAMDDAPGWVPSMA